MNRYLFRNDHVLDAIKGAAGDIKTNKPQALNLRNKQSRVEIKMDTDNCCIRCLK